MEQKVFKNKGGSSVIKGDKIKLVKPMGVFKNIGEVCEVIDVSQEGFISFKFGDRHLGCMSYDEFQRYFILVEEKKREWSEWEKRYISIGSINKENMLCYVYVRNNGKTIQMKTKDKYNGKLLRVKSVCCDDDKFCYEKGLELVEVRMMVKLLKHQAKELAASM